MKRVLFISGREINYPRNYLFLSALAEFCEVDVIGSTKLNVSKGGGFSILGESLKSILRAFPKLIKERYDFIFVGFYGQLLIFPISLFSKSPLVFDVFLSTYDTLINDREKFSEDSLIAKMSFFLDKYSCKRADLIFIDTQAHGLFFNAMFDTPLDKIHSIFVGCDENIFYPRDIEVDDKKVLYYCSYLPLHGASTVVMAAKLLQDSIPVRFKLVGEGNEYPKIKELVKMNGIRNIDFSPSIPLEELPQEIGTASICLGGHFGNSQKSKNVISGKTFQMLAMKKPVIVGDNLANKELLSNNYDALFCEMNNPEALAAAIEKLYLNHDIKELISTNGYQTYLNKASQKVLRKQVATIIGEAIS